MNQNIDFTIGETIQIPEYGEATIEKITQQTTREGDHVRIEYDSEAGVIESVLKDSSNFFVTVVNEDGDTDTFNLPILIEKILDQPSE